MSMLTNFDVVEDAAQVPESERCVWKPDRVNPHGVQAANLLLALCCGWSRAYCVTHAVSMEHGLRAMERLCGGVVCTECGARDVAFTWIPLPKGGA
jgi:hypothetical protein